MGQCTSSKSSQIDELFNKKKSKTALLKPAAKDNKMEKGKRCPQITRGQVTMFGFKKPTTPSSGARGGGLPTQPSLPSVPASVTQETIEPLVIAPVQPRQGTPKLSRAKKDGGKTANRFGFRPPTAMSNKVADMHQTDSRSESDFRQTTRPQSTPALKLASQQRSVSETRYNNKSPNSAPARGASNVPADELASQGAQQKSGKYALKTSRLPQPLSATYRPPTGCNGIYSTNIVGPQADKWAKTKANNQKAAQSKQLQSSSASNTCSSSPTDSGIGVQKSCKNDAVLEIQQLEHSPSMGHKFRNFQHQKARPMEMIFADSHTKRFELRDVAPVQPVRPMVMAAGSEESAAGRIHQPFLPNSPPQQPSIPAINCTPAIATSSSGDEGFDEVSNEEKQSRDKLSSEKVRLGCSPDDEDTANMDGEDEETMWGRGEAMALDDQIPCASIADIDQSPESTTPRLRSVLLTIEDPEFTSLAVMAQSTNMLEDEVSPESPDFSCSSPTSVEPLPPPPNLAEETPGSPGTPTQATNSLSSDAKDRDFLIDDEIADQPGLVFDTEDRHRLRHDSLDRIGARSRDNLDIVSSINIDDTSILDRSRTISKLAGEVSQVLASMNGTQQYCRNSRQQCGSTTSLNTLSPCESLASDDLMADYDISARFDDLNELDDEPLKTEILSQSDQVMKEWNSLLSTHPGLSNGATTRTPSKPIRPRMRSTSSGSASPSSIPPAHSRVQMNSSYGEGACSMAYEKIERDKLDQMAHEVAYIKSMLVKLKIVLEETEDGHRSQVDDFDKKNSLYTGLAASEAASAPGEGATCPQLADLQRQIVLLNAQLEERDSRIERLEEALRRSNEARPPPATSGVSVNVATQTDRIRPLSSGPTLFQTSPDNTSTSFVSSADPTTTNSTIAIQILNLVFDLARLFIGIENNPARLSTNQVLPMCSPNRRKTDSSLRAAHLKHI